MSPLSFGQTRIAVQATMWAALFLLLRGLETAFAISLCFLSQLRSYQRLFFLWTGFVDHQRFAYFLFALRSPALLGSNLLQQVAQSLLPT